MPQQIQLPVLGPPPAGQGGAGPESRACDAVQAADTASLVTLPRSSGPLAGREPEEPSPQQVAQAAERLLDFLRNLGGGSPDEHQGRHLLVAFSGGVDSSLVAAAAWRAVGHRAVAVTGVSPSVSQEDRQAAHQLASALGISHVLLPTPELSNARYVQNDARRCFHCKDGLYHSIDAWARSRPPQLAQETLSTQTRPDAAESPGPTYHLLSGTNRDDLGDYRPGLQAATKWQVIAPLAELGIGKSLVRGIARLWQIPNAMRPASPCLASRLAYGQAVSLERLERIEAAERFLKHQIGLVDVRVRLHADELARVEIDRQQWPLIMQPATLERIDQQLKQLGFHFVTLDLGGRQSGSLNRGLPEVALDSPPRSS
jgi:pyridinium-3,5-biscarboxylic acid mononucleotide sulfurtransferase